MQIVHGRNQQTVAEVRDLRILTVQRSQISRHSSHTAVGIDCQITVFKYFKMVFLLRIEDMSFINLFHISYCNIPMQKYEFFLIRTRIKRVY